MTLRSLIRSVDWAFPGYMDAQLKIASSPSKEWQILSIYQDKETLTVWIDIEPLIEQKKQKESK